MDRPYSPAPRVDITLEQGQLATLRFFGAIRADDLHRAHRELHDRLGGKTVVGLVLDARFSTPDYTPGQLLDSLESCLDFSSPQRCAFVATQVREETLTLIETACVPFAVRVRGFEDADRAMRWALGL